jgi:hypothetical protein
MYLSVSGVICLYVMCFSVSCVYLYVLMHLYVSVFISKYLYVSGRIMHVSACIADFFADDTEPAATSSKHLVLGAVSGRLHSVHPKACVPTLFFSQLAFHAEAVFCTHPARSNCPIPLRRPSYSAGAAPWNYLRAFILSQPSLSRSGVLAPPPPLKKPPDRDSSIPCWLHTSIPIGSRGYLICRASAGEKQPCSQCFLNPLNKQICSRETFRLCVSKSFIGK